MLAPSFNSLTKRLIKPLRDEFINRVIGSKYRKLHQYHQIYRVTILNASCNSPSPSSSSNFSLLNTATAIKNAKRSLERFNEKLFCLTQLTSFINWLFTNRFVLNYLVLATKELSYFTHYRPVLL